MGQGLVAAVVAADGLGLLQGSQRAEDTTFSRSTGGATATDHRTQCGGIPVTTDREQLAVFGGEALGPHRYRLDPSSGKSDRLDSIQVCLNGPGGRAPDPLRPFWPR